MNEPDLIATTCSGALTLPLPMMVKKFRHIIARANLHTAFRIRRTFVFVGKLKKALGRSSSISSLSNMEQLDCRIRRTFKPATGHVLAQTL